MSFSTPDSGKRRPSTTSATESVDEDLELNPVPGQLQVDVESRQTPTDLLDADGDPELKGAAAAPLDPNKLNKADSMLVGLTDGMGNGVPLAVALYKLMNSREMQPTRHRYWLDPMLVLGVAADGWKCSIQARLTSNPDQKQKLFADGKRLRDDAFNNVGTVIGNAFSPNLLREQQLLSGECGRIQLIRAAANWKTDGVDYENLLKAENLGITRYDPATVQKKYDDMVVQRKEGRQVLSEIRAAQGPIINPRVGENSRFRELPRLAPLNVSQDIRDNLVAAKTALTTALGANHGEIAPRLLAIAEAAKNPNAFYGAALTEHKNAYKAWFNARVSGDPTLIASTEARFTTAKAARDLAEAAAKRIAVEGTTLQSVKEELGRKKTPTLGM